MCSSLPPFGSTQYNLNYNSMIWSLSKNKLLNGPDYMKALTSSPYWTRFGHTCAIAINKTAVLFIGLQDEIKLLNNEMVPNTI